MKHGGYVYIACQKLIPQWKQELPEMTKLGKSGAAHPPRTNRLCRKRSFPRQFYFDVPHELTLPERTTTMTGYVSESTVYSLAMDTDASDTVALDQSHYEASRSQGRV